MHRPLRLPRTGTATTAHGDGCSAGLDSQAFPDANLTTLVLDQQVLGAAHRGICVAISLCVVFCACEPRCTAGMTFGIRRHGLSR